MDNPHLNAGMSVNGESLNFYRILFQVLVTLISLFSFNL